ncbi:MAG: DUF805 domain-containing protein [Pseudomonadota bacterium]
MPLRTLLFSPNGRIGPRDFLRGVILLVGVSIVNQVLSVYGSLAFAPVSIVVSLAVFYGYICVYGKRLHDRGLSAWLFVLIFIAYLILDMVVQSILTPLLAPGAIELQEGMADMLTRGRMEDAVVFMQDLAREILFTALLSLLITNAVLAFLVARLQGDPGMNPHGPPPGGDQTFR